MTDIKRILCNLADVVLPRRCAVCGKFLLADERDICLECLCDIPYTHSWNDRDAWLLSLFYYNDVSPYKRLALSVKYMGNSSLGRRMGWILGVRTAFSSVRPHIDIVAPVPLHWRRKWSRGYNQAEEIASGFVDGYRSVAYGGIAETGIAEACIVEDCTVEAAGPVLAQRGGVPPACRQGADTILLPSLLRRNRHTNSQTKVGVDSKAGNVRGAFSIGKDRQAFEELLSRRGHLTVLLMDDTCTTGATLFSCADALKPYRGKVDVLFAAMAKVRED